MQCGVKLKDVDRLCTAPIRQHGLPCNPIPEMVGVHQQPYIERTVARAGCYGDMVPTAGGVDAMLPTMRRTVIPHVLFPGTGDSVG